MTDEPETHPVQHASGVYGAPARAPTAVTLAAYEVYCHVYSPQEALVTGGCRGGFSAGELIGLLYARSFPKAEWRKRVNEAFNGMTGL